MKDEHVNNKKWGVLVNKGLLGKPLTKKEIQQISAIAMTNMGPKPDKSKKKTKKA